MLVLPVQAGESLERVRAAVTEAKALAKKDIDLAVLFKLSLFSTDLSQIHFC